MPAFLKQLKALWTRQSPAQKTGIVAALALAAAAVTALVLFGSASEFRTLATGLDRTEAQKVLAKLDEAGVEYRLADEGRSVEVPAERWNEVQRILVQNNLLAGTSGKGYAGLADIPFGRTEAQLKVEIRKAQEEQLALTLERFEEVEEAVVHITPAARGISKQDTRPAKASVMIRTKPGRMLPASQVEAVVQLVAHAVDGLEPAHVAVTDFRGTLLSRPEGAGRVEAVTAVYGREVERHLQEKAESALAAALGPSKAVVRVDAELDLEKIDSTKRTIDPETKVVVNETQRSSTGRSPAARGAAGTTAATDGSASGGSAGSSTEDTEATYRYAEEEVRRTKEIGQVKRLTVGVLVDESLKEKGKDIEGMVKGAVGFNPARDTFDLAFVAFAAPPAAAAEGDAAAFDWALAIEIAKWIVTLVVGSFLALYAWRSVRSARASLGEALQKVEKESGSHLAMAHRPDPQDEVRRLVDEDVESVGRVLRNWLYEPVKR